MIFPKKILVAFLVVIIAGAAAYILFFHNPKDETSGGTPGSQGSSTQSAEQKPEEEPLPVKAALAQKGDLLIRLKSAGEAVTEKRITVKTEVSGVIKNLRVKEGMHVREGDLLVEIEDREYRLRLEQREAGRLKALSELFLERQFAVPDRQPDSQQLERVDKTREAFEKAAGLWGRGMISREEYEKAKMDYEFALIETGAKKDEVMATAKGLTQSEVEVKIAQMELEKTKIRAAFSGVITDIKVSPKENVTAGRELFTLVNISDIKVQAMVLESEVGRIRVGRPADLKFTAYPGKVFKGTVEAISPIVNPQDKTCKVHVAVSNIAGEIKPGMHAEVEITAEVHTGRVLIPQEAVLVRAGRKLAFVVEEGLAKWRYIEVGLENDDFAEVLDGVKEGEIVIVEGHLTLAHDARVKVAVEPAENKDEKTK